MAEARVIPHTVLADRYVIERKLGQGGMASVFQAVDLKHSRPVALKVLRQELGPVLGPERFLREIRVLSTLNHPHIVPLLDSGSSDGVLFYVMPFIEGRTLRERLRDEVQLTVAETLRIARQLADGLAYAHARGVIHRDIKPENILLSEGHALLADFGIAYAIGHAEANERLTESGLAIGSPMYMSPEQAVAGGRIDARTDLYSLGCVLYEMLTGAPPFSGPNQQAIMARHACDPVPPIGTVRSTVPPHVEAAILQLLAKSPADRIQSAAVLVEALEQPPVARGSGARWRRWGAAMLAASSVGAGILWFRHDSDSGGRRDLLMVADFLGPPGDSTLALAVRELVTVELDQSRSLSTMPREQVASALRAAGIPGSALVSPELARELAYRSSVRAVVTGSVLPVGGSGYSIALRALGAEDGREIASVAGSASPDELIRSVQGLARQLRARLGERRSSIAATRSLEEVATPSFPAYRLFVEGRDRLYAGDFATGNRLLLQAIGLDSAFASAWAALGTSYVFGRDLDSARLAYGRALTFRERLSEDQRFRVEADAAYALRHDLPAAIGWYDLYLSRNPESGAAHNNRALFLSSLGRHEEALEEFRRALAVNPFGPEQVQIELLNQAAELIVLGRIREAEAAAGDLRGPFAQYFAILLPSATSNWRAAESTATVVAETEGTPSFLRIQATTTWAAATAARGAVTRADRLLRSAQESASGEEMRWYAQARLLLALVSGRRPEPTPAILTRDSTAAGRIVSALWAAARGDSQAAAEALEKTRRRSDETAFLGAGPRLAQGWIDADAGRWRAVVDSLGPLAARGEHDATLLDRVPAFPVRWLVADAYAHLSRLDSATTYMRLVLEPTLMAPGHFAMRGLPYSFAHLRLALWYAELGDSAQARVHWRRIAETLTDPDPDLRQLLSQSPAASPSEPPGRRGR